MDCGYERYMPYNYCRVVQAREDFGKELAIVEFRLANGGEDHELEQEEMKRDQ